MQLPLVDCLHILLLCSNNQDADDDDDDMKNKEETADVSPWCIKSKQPEIAKIYGEQKKKKTNLKE